jgi:lysophospholipase L1-like esterase
VKRVLLLVVAVAVLALTAVLAVTALPGGPLGSGARADASATPYYLALGDSLATGGGATAGESYVDDIFHVESSVVPGLQLENLACSGDSTGRMIDGGLCTNYTTGTQLGDAEAFLSDHPGQVSFVTIDVGGDDIDGCGFDVTAIDPTCVSAALSRIATNLPIIMAGLRQAGGSVPIVGMTYYDPSLAAYVTGAPLFPGTTSENRTLAHQSVAVLQKVNRELAGVYRKYGAKVANVAAPFASANWSPTGSFAGQTVPLNVADLCNWTHMCDTASGDPNVHANDTGHGILADAFEKVLRLHRSRSGAHSGGRFQPK